MARANVKLKVVPEYLTTTQIAELTQRTNDWVLREIREGRLAAIDFAKPGSQKPRYRIHRADWDAYVNRLRVSPKAAATPRRRPDLHVAREFV